MTKAILVSPGKGNQQLVINTPTICALDSFQNKQVVPDTSWDNADWVEMRQEEDAVVSRQDRLVERHRKLKATGEHETAAWEHEAAAWEHEAAAWEHEAAAKERETSAQEREAAAEEMCVHVANAEASSILLLKAHIDDINRKLPNMEVVEEYKVVSLLLQGLNDRLFDVNQRDQAVTQAEKDILKKNKLHYSDCNIFSLNKGFNAKQEDYVVAINFNIPTLPATGKQKLTTVFEKARDLLTTEDTPDQIKKQMEMVAPTHTVTVANLLASKLQQMCMAEDTDSTDRRLIVDASEYYGLVEEQVLRAELVEELRRLEACQAEDVKTNAKWWCSDSVL
ncbi:hypothetical protein B0H10DRAFT_2427680 [Mycena sp. CBHHK59/15]|nr:hypothetical protein B0H10DRAFT_2427680 [Mycena sp. CBHHK59/15]